MAQRKNQEETWLILCSVNLYYSYNYSSVEHASYILYN